MPVRPARSACALLLCGLLAACGAPRPAPSAQASALPEGFSEALLALSPAPAPALGAQAAACPTQLALPYGASGLDTGLYWYSRAETGAPGGVGCKARADGAAIPGYYDPARPVMIFVHGWQDGSTKAGKRDSFYFSEANQSVADAWIAAGWNVALYHWTQLADDEGTAGVPYHAQAKIWTAAYTYRDALGRTQDIRMRYRQPDGSYTQAGMPTVSAGQLFYAAYKSALSAWTYSGAEGVRVMGHSLGAQMALALADRAAADPALPAGKRPSRIILADPYWSPASPGGGHSYSFLSPDATPAARSARIAQALKNSGVAVEWIKSSRLNDLGGDNNLAMAKFISRTEIFPEYVFDLNPASGLARKHGVAPRWYMWTRSFAPNGAVSAANALAAAVGRMNSGVRYDQQGGRSTVSPGDDTFVSGPNP
ncbi:hypothetical protein [Deinococcus multiflagellatus]|uniref:Uncharacterized protein n=1 Tax=Deinococcus multiflagellatus TaxID=1656887 RepID=A0ABW1ZJ24_9DEIO|nr:hypothetical protein [Deinococcus multiflagellatus]MBZ9713111.1 hypothetical protein [Deinococcus multiflagellatus]